MEKRKDKSAASVLREMAETYEERNVIYGDNFKNVGHAMAALFPNGVQLKYEQDHRIYHLFELIIVKASRFANAGLMHKDSIHDIGVYAAMIEHELSEMDGV